jgi:hypothetical protein
MPAVENPPTSCQAALGGRIGLEHRSGHMRRRDAILSLFDYFPLSR